MAETAPRIIDAAVRAIAEDNAALHIACAISRGEVERHLDDAVLTAWIRREADQTSPEDVLDRAIAALTTAQCEALLVVPAVRDALRSLCIADLAHEAEALQERERMLGEDWGRPYDPIAADRRALAREVAAANRAMRAQP